ncbi:MAG TPA: hypothetical protein DC047_15975 [Blastocatellia bacterium]|nr:hypothetical protein [Blastocatellia bacterium]
MNPLKIRTILRWILTILFAAAGIFFQIIGFSTALLGEGAEAGELRKAWGLHAAFLLSFAMLLWLASVLIFLGLRPGGFLRIIRGQQINSFKRWLYIACLIASLAGFLLSDPRVFYTKFEINRCLDKGGKWTYSTNSCQ